MLRTSFCCRCCRSHQVRPESQSKWFSNFQTVGALRGAGRFSKSAVFRCGRTLDFKQKVFPCIRGFNVRVMLLKDCPDVSERQLPHRRHAKSDGCNVWRCSLLRVRLRIAIGRVSCPKRVDVDASLCRSSSMAFEHPPCPTGVVVHMVTAAPESTIIQVTFCSHCSVRPR